MSGKGGYAESAPQFSVLKLIDLKELQDQRCATTSATVTAAPSSQGESMAQSKDPAEQAQPSDVDQPARTSVGWPRDQLLTVSLKVAKIPLTALVCDMEQVNHVRWPVVFDPSSFVISRIVNPSATFASCQ